MSDSTRIEPALLGSLPLWSGTPVSSPAIVTRRSRETQSKRSRGTPSGRSREAQSKAPSQRGAPSYHLSQSDAVSWLRTLSPGSVDLLITDPPYESLEKHRAVGTTTRLKHSKASSNDWFQIFPNVRFPELFREAYRVLKKGAHFYLFCDQETLFVAKPAAEAAGFKFWKPLVWDKQKIGMGYHYRSRYEMILFFEKGKRKLNDLGVPDIITCPRVFNGYPTEKPAYVARVLIEQSSNEREVVADPFMGSGSTGMAALASGRHFLGNDLGSEALRIARENLAQSKAKLDGDLYLSRTS